MSGTREPTATAEPRAGIPNLGERLKTTADVLTRCQDTRELPDGIVLSYPRSGSWPATLEIFVRNWSKSCPHMAFQVNERDGRLDLEIRGPEGTREFFEGARIMLNSHLNPAPTKKNRMRRGIRRLTSRIRILPEFLIIGAKKCGTTSLYAYLTQHPSIAPAYRKEVYYFTACFHFGPQWYRTFFPTVFERSLARLGGRKGYLTGEATPDYLFDPKSPGRAHALLPQAKLIALLRNPVDRAYSFYQHNLRAGVEQLSFEDAIDAEEERLAGEEAKIRADQPSFAWENYAYCLRGRYAGQVERWLELYPPEQLRVFATEELQSDPAGVVRRVHEYLGLPPIEPQDFRRLNAVPYPDMDPKTRRKLLERFEPHNRRLYELLGTDFHWEDS